ncbi:unnamed protein product [Dicrocoelium dendriticum]|nr:unnamed protein product [Dicrocoelium dendriticum]
MLESQSLHQAFPGATLTRPKKSKSSVPSELADFHIEGEECALDRDIDDSERPTFTDIRGSLCGMSAIEDDDDGEDGDEDGDDGMEEGHADLQSYSSTEEAHYSEVHCNSKSSSTILTTHQPDEEEGSDGAPSKVNRCQSVTPTPESGLKSAQHNPSARSAHVLKGGKLNGIGIPKACAKKSFVWKYFHHPELTSGVLDRSRTQCILCDSQLAFNASGTTTTMLNHLKSRHGDIAEQEELHRRHSRSKGVTGANRLTNNEHGAGTVQDVSESNGIDSTTAHRHVPHAMSTIVRSPNGHKGRPPGSSRRSKLPKAANSTDYSSQSSALRVCQMKPEANQLFPLACYAGLPDQRALLNGILLQTETLNGTNEDTYHGSSQNDLRSDIDSLFTNAAGISAASLHGRLLPDQPDSNLIATMAANNMLPFPFFNRTFPMRAMCALSNGPLSTATASGQLQCPVSHELSPSSSSGLGVSVSSPFETPTTSASPPNSADNRNVISPHWPGAQHEKQQRQQKGQSRTHDTQHSTLPTGQLLGYSDVSAPINQISLNGHGSTLNSPTGKASTDAFMGHPNEGSSGGGHPRQDAVGGLHQGVQSHAGATLSHGLPNLSHTTSANFWNLMNFIPQLSGYAAMSQQQQQHQQQQHRQQLQEQHQQWLVANALFTGLANGKPFSDSDMLAGSTALLSAFSNEAESLPNGTVKMNGSNPANGVKDLPLKPHLPIPIGAFAESLPHLQHQQQWLKAASDRFLAWSHMHRPNTTVAVSTGEPSLITSPPVDVTQGMGAPPYHKIPMHRPPTVSSASHPSCSTPNLFAPVSLGSPKSSETNLSTVCGINCNEASMSFIQARDSNATDSLDLSTPRNETTTVMQTNNDLCQSTMHTFMENGVPLVASAKRKRARPMYISPQFDQKRRLVTDGETSPEQCATDLRSLNSIAEDISHPTESSRGASSYHPRQATVERVLFVEHLAYYLIRDLQPPEVIEGEGFKFRDPETLKAALQRCYRRRSEAHLSACDAKLCMLAQPCSLVTNNPDRLNAMLNSASVVGGKQDDEQFLVLPCLVSGLAKAVMAGLKLPRIQDLLNNARRLILSTVPLSNGSPRSPDAKQPRPTDSVWAHTRDSATDEGHPAGETCAPMPFTSWASVYSLLKKLNQLEPAPCMDPMELQLLKQLQAVLEALNQTLELIHRKDLILTASMIGPILQNLQHTYLVSSDDVDDQSESTAVDEFIVTLSQHLKALFSDNETVREVLQLSSLLDPRFKEHVQEKLPATVKLLKSKLESIPVTSDEATRTTSNSSDSSSAGRVRSSSDKADLQNVFGLQSFPRSSLPEVDRYLREDPIGLEEDPLAWWVEKSAGYPRVAALAFRYLTIPLTCFVNGRLRSLCPIEGDQPDGVSYDSIEDGLGLPNIVDPLGRDRCRLRPEDQIAYNLLWHNWKSPL